ncbi:hypothetical protein ACTOB_005381 [Actinoplanes oblitus]|uniref:Uncharacterized protein n=1 Tax=Actinoplanes oblitus TaxID=3040509 RepID=A0ABY8WAI2_9ACTN|nr:hypothetical protein [Actinoplanes oblitus]WIM93404.1 hypothetical protein ACTOB_005381 [Actinoplanes oblitus]
MHPVLAFLIRYGLAATAAWATFVAEAVLLLAGLLAWSLGTDQGIGSPLGGPLLVLGAAVLGAGAAAAVCVPATIAGELTARGRHWVLLPLTAVGAVAVLLALIETAIVALAGPAPAPVLVSWLAGWGLLLAGVAPATLVCAGASAGVGRLLARRERRRAARAALLPAVHWR